MTIKYKNSLKPILNGWITEDSNQTSPSDLDKLYQELMELPKLKPCSAIFDECKIKEEPLSMYIYSLVVLVTDQEETPKWSIWDNFISNSSNGFLENYKEHLVVLQQRLADRNITGYKLISTKMSDTMDTYKILSNYCESQFNPKPKVYINGPKKNNEFLAKKAKQYVKANNL